jgi:hypothetical protein
MPRASVNIATAVKPGDFFSERRAKRRSGMMFGMDNDSDEEIPDLFF